jgi:hypothetical protein
MTHRERDEVVMPMAVDGGAAGLEQSRHHQNAGLSAQGPTHTRAGAEDDENTGSDREIDEIRTKITSMVQSEIIGEVLAMMGRWAQLAAEEATRRERRVDDEQPITRREVREMLDIMATLKKKIGTPQPAQTRSWASIASSPPGQSTGSAAWMPRKVVPARHAREVVIKTKGGTPPQSPAAMVAKVNTALGPGSGDALAIRRLQSGDIVVSFRGNAEDHARNESWVKAAFGDQAAIARRTYTVLAKGIPRSLIEKKKEEDIQKEIEEVNEVKMARCRKRIPKSSEAKYGMLLIEVESVTTAQEICSRGVILEAQFFNCEPYSGDLKVLQCFNCHAYGHMAKACTRKAKCGFCGTEAHAGGDNNCPKKQGGTPSCINCKGQHAAWDRSCHAALAERQRIKEAYAYRPRQFVVGGSDASWTSHSGQSAPSTEASSSSEPAANRDRIEVDDDGYQEVAPKKRRMGRPRDMDRPEQGNRRVDEVFASQRTTRSQSVVTPQQAGPESTQPEW